MRYFILIIAFLCAAPSMAFAQADLSDLISADQLSQPEFVPPYRQEIEDFNKISDDELLAEIMPAEDEPEQEKPDNEALDGDDTKSAVPLFNQKEDKPRDLTKEFSVNETDIALYQQVPQSVLDDAQNFFESCGRDHHMSTHYECRCMAKHYLDKAIEHGPGYSRTGILSQMQNYCPNTVKMAGIFYKKCFTQGFLMPKNKSMEEYCSCYGNEYAKYMTDSEARMGARKMSAAQKHAIGQCSD